jgi:hypothetical protein
MKYKHGAVIGCEQCKHHGLRSRTYCKPCDRLLKPRNWKNKHEADAHALVGNNIGDKQRKLKHIKQQVSSDTPVVSYSVPVANYRLVGGSSMRACYTNDADMGNVLKELNHKNNADVWESTVYR